MKRPSLHRGALARRVLLVGLLALGLCACEDTRPPMLDGHGGFDPTRFDAGPLPALSTAEKTAPLPFATTPIYAADARQTGTTPLHGYLERHVGVPVPAVFPTSYGDTVDRFARGELGIAQLSPLAFVTAEARTPGTTCLATMVAQGTTSYAGYIIARADGPVQSVADLKGRRFGFVDKHSASGHLFPRLWLARHGYDPEMTFGEVTYVGSQDRAVDAVLRGDVDAAAVASDVLVAQRATGPGARLRILANTGRIPYDCLAAHPSVPKAVQDRVRAAILKLSVHSAEGRRVLGPGALTSGWVPVPPGHYARLRAAMRLLSKQSPDHAVPGVPAPTTPDRGLPAPLAPQTTAPQTTAPQNTVPRATAHADPPAAIQGSLK